MLRTKYRLMLMLVLALFALTSIAFAGTSGVVHDAPVINCDGASVTFHVPTYNAWNWTLSVDDVWVNGGSGFNYSDIHGEDITANNVGSIYDPFPFADGTHTVEFLINVEPSLQTRQQAADLIITETIDCPDGGSEQPSLAPGRACFGPGEVAAAVFVTGSAIEIWTINNDRGELAIKMLKEDIYAEYIPGTPVKVAESDLHIHVELWMQANGYPRVVAGPDAEGKIFECVIGGRYSRVRSYFPGQVGPDEMSPELPAQPTPQPTAQPTPTPV